MRKPTAPLRTLEKMQALTNTSMDADVEPRSTRQ